MRASSAKNPGSTIAMGTAVSTTIAAANPSRMGLIIQPSGAGAVPLFLSFGTTPAANGVGITLVTADQIFVLQGDPMYTGPVQGFITAAGGFVKVAEF